MKVDPNLPIGLQPEYVRCEGDTVYLHDGGSTPLSELGDPAGAFYRFCKELDPNKTFIIALITDESGKEAFFQARNVARSIGVHVQAPVEAASRCRSMWEAYVVAKRAASAGPDDAPTEP